MVPSLASFSPSYHLDVQDIAVDSLSAPSCMRLRVKGLKTDPFRKRVFIHIGLGQPLLSGVHSVKPYLTRRGDVPGPLFLFQNGNLSHVPCLQTGFSKSWHLRTSQATSSATASALGLSLWLLAMKCLITSCKPLVLLVKLRLSALY